jgi:hypothetical protein
MAELLEDCAICHGAGLLNPEEHPRAILIQPWRFPSSTKLISHGADGRKRKNKGIKKYIMIASSGFGGAT